MVVILASLYCATSPGRFIHTLSLGFYNHELLAASSYMAAVICSVGREKEMQTHMDGTDGEDDLDWLL